MAASGGVGGGGGDGSNLVGSSDGGGLGVVVLMATVHCSCGEIQHKCKSDFDESRMNQFHRKSANL